MNIHNIGFHFVDNVIRAMVHVRFEYVVICIQHSLMAILVRQNFGAGAISVSSREL